MKKTRVSKGEKYWYIVSDFFAGDFYTTRGVDFYEDIQDGRFAMGNYFRTKEEAESMAKKLRAVLNGAEVIEMPSEYDIDDVANNLDSEPCCLHEIKEECITKNHAYMAGFLYGVKWIISKIVK